MAGDESTGDLKRRIEEYLRLAAMKYTPKGLPTLYGLAYQSSKSVHSMTHHGVSFEECNNEDCVEARAVLARWENEPSHYSFEWQKDTLGFYARCGGITFYAVEHKDKLDAESKHFQLHADCPHRPKEG